MFCKSHDSEVYFLFYLLVLFLMHDMTWFILFPVFFFSFPLSGTYECRTTVDSMPYVVWQRIMIPDPNIQVNGSKVIKCGNLRERLQCCVQQNYKVEWTSSKVCSEHEGTSCFVTDIGGHEKINRIMQKKIPTYFIFRESSLSLWKKTNNKYIVYCIFIINVNGYWLNIKLCQITTSVPYINKPIFLI